MKYPASIFPWLLLAAGSMMLVLCARRLLDRQELQIHGLTTAAIVEWATTTGARSNQLQVVFRDADGRSWAKVFAVYSSQYITGQSVDVVYLPRDPEIAMLGAKEAGVKSGQEALGAALGGLAVLISAAWLAALRGRRDRE
jgi:hypothetical protein